MRCVAVFLSDETTVRRLTVAFSGECVGQSFSSVDAVRQSVRGGMVLAMIVDMQFGEDVSVPMIAQLRHEHPHMPILAYVNFSPQHARTIVSAAHAGADDIILRDFDDPRTAARRILTLGIVNEVSVQVMAAVGHLLPEDLHKFVRFCLANAPRALTVEQTLRQAYNGHDDVSQRLAAANLPKISRMVGWARLLVAARFLEDPSRSAERVAREMQFGTASGLRNMLRRYVDCGPEVMRQRGGLEYVLERFRQELSTAYRAV
jgi:DNA-binding NarL/FixJ family response regulator